MNPHIDLQYFYIVICMNKISTVSPMFIDDHHTFVFDFCNWWFDENLLYQWHSSKMKLLHERQSIKIFISTKISSIEIDSTFDTSKDYDAWQFKLDLKNKHRLRTHQYNHKNLKKKNQSELFCSFYFFVFHQFKIHIF